VHQCNELETKIATSEKSDIRIGHQNRNSVNRKMEHRNTWQGLASNRVFYTSHDNQKYRGSASCGVTALHLKLESSLNRQNRRNPLVRVSLQDRLVPRRHESALSSLNPWEGSASKVYFFSSSRISSVAVRNPW